MSQISWAVREPKVCKCQQRTLWFGCQMPQLFSICPTEYTWFTDIKHPIQVITTSCLILTKKVSLQLMVESPIKSQLTCGNPVGFSRQKTFRGGLSLPASVPKSSGWSVSQESIPPDIFWQLRATRNGEKNELEVVFPFSSKKPI